MPFLSFTNEREAERGNCVTLPKVTQQIMTQAGECLISKTSSSLLGFKELRAELYNLGQRPASRQGGRGCLEQLFCLLVYLSATTFL